MVSGEVGRAFPISLKIVYGNPVLIENEYARILVEEGVLGLIAWIAFIVWLLIKAWPRRRDSWYVARLLLWGGLSFSFASAPVGTGLLTSIPGTTLVFLASGWLIGRARAGSAGVTFRSAHLDRRSAVA